MRDMILAQAGVAFRAAVLAAVGYGAWGFVSGSGHSPAAYAAVAVSLWLLANAAFLIAKWYRPDMLDTAAALEDEL
jgi:hypothetical protein